MLLKSLRLITLFVFCELHLMSLFIYVIPFSFSISLFSTLQMIRKTVDLLYHSERELFTYLHMPSLSDIPTDTPVPAILHLINPSPDLLLGSCLVLHGQQLLYVLLEYSPLQLYHTLLSSTFRLLPSHLTVRT